MNLENSFHTQFGSRPTTRVQAPGRINLIGEHIDYLGGCVMPAAIDRHLTMVAGPKEDGDVEISSTAIPGEPVRVSLEDLTRREHPEQSWLNYIIGVLAGYRARGIEIPPFRAVIDTTIPSGAGLSSSAALETATALTVEALTCESRDTIDRALICQKAEHDFALVPCGIMDQLAVGASQAGHALLIDCRDLGMKHVAIPEGLAIVVADTGVNHALADGEYRKRREDCEEAARLIGAESLRDVGPSRVEEHRGHLGDRLFRRARHAVTEMARVHRFAEALEQRDAEEIGSLMRASHDSLRDDFEVSCPELDALVEAAYEFGPGRGLLGSRMTGGGFGGSTVSLVRDEYAADFQSHLAESFKKRFGRSITPFKTSAAAGARILH